MQPTRNRLFALLTSVCALVAALGAVELGLRLGGFRYHLYPERIEFGWPNPQELEEGFVEDDDLFWVHPDYARRLRPPGIVGPTAVFLGDSCTELGNYDTHLARLAAQRLAGWRPSFVKIGVAGWSSYQGLNALRRDIVPLAPRLVTIYFGWNDHWVGFGIEDKEVARVKARTPGAFDGLRVVQAAQKAWVALRGRGAPGLRVAPEDYRRNLESMIDLARAHGIVPVLITAPTSHRVGQEPQWLSKRHLPDLNRLVPLHREYVMLTREVAREREAPLCDMAAVYETYSPRELEEYFWEDGIHLRSEGNRVFADLLFDCLRSHDLLELLVP
jgi:lysophospholipase L1-like esterase